MKGFLEADFVSTGTPFNLNCQESAKPLDVAETPDVQDGSLAVPDMEMPLLTLVVINDAPDKETVGINVDITETDARADPHTPKKLHSETENVYVFPGDRNELGMRMGGAT